VSGQVWLYRPPHHKTAWRGRERVIALGPKAQAVIKPFLTLDTSASLFSPRRALAERAAVLRAKRKTRVQPSPQNPRKSRPRRAPGERYTVTAYATAVRRACVKAGVPQWHPGQLRHNHATAVRKTYGLEAAQVALGHAQACITQVYAERDMALAM